MNNLSYSYFSCKSSSVKWKLTDSITDSLTDTDEILKCQVSNIMYQLIQNQVLNVKFQMLHSKCQISNLIKETTLPLLRNNWLKIKWLPLAYQISNVKFHISNFKCQKSNTRYKISIFKYHILNPMLETLPVLLNNWIKIKWLPLTYQISNFKYQN